MVTIASGNDMFRGYMSYLVTCTNCSFTHNVTTKALAEEYKAQHERRGCEE